jgi:hypothetical protein
MKLEETLNPERNLAKRTPNTFFAVKGDMPIMVSRVEMTRTNGVHPLERLNPMSCFMNPLKQNGSLLHFFINVFQLSSNLINSLGTEITLIDTVNIAHHLVHTKSPQIPLSSSLRLLSL